MAGFADDKDTVDEGLHATEPEADVSGYKAKPQHVMEDGSVIVADNLGELLKQVEASHVFPTQPVE